MSKVIYFSIDDNYTFSQGMLFLSFKDNSPKIFNEVDFIIYHNGITEKNQKLLKSVAPNLEFIDFRKNDFIPEEIYKNPFSCNWGPCPINTLFAYKLVHDYDQVLHLDSDMLITGPIDDIFNYDCDFGYRPSGHKIKKTVKLPEDAPDFPISAGFTNLFSNSILKYNITSESLLDAYKKVKDSPLGGAYEERIMSWLAYIHKMKTLFVSYDYGSQYYYFNPATTRILHYADRGYPAKPWKNSIAYICYPQWYYYYRRWQDLGGTVPEINFNSKSYFNPNVAYLSIKSATRFCHVANKLDAIRHPDIRPKFGWDSADWYFYIENFPKEIFFKISCVGVFYDLSLKITNPQYLTPEVLAILEQCHKGLAVPDGNKNYEKTRDYAEISVILMREAYLNIIFNQLISLSLPKLKNIFLS